MAIRFKCACGRWLRAEPEQAGGSVTCPACGGAAAVPGAGSPPTRHSTEHAPAVLPAALESDVPVVEYAGEPPLSQVAGLADTSRARNDESVRPRRRDQRESDDGEPEPAITSAPATGSLVCGVTSFFTVGVTGVLALVLGVLALVQIRRSNGRLRGKNLAVTGMILGVVLGAGSAGLAWQAYSWLRSRGDEMAFRANQRMRQSKLQQVGFALASHEVGQGHFPPAAICDANGRPLLSWRVAILPEIGEGALFREFHLDEPWDSPHNKKLISQMPDLFAAPGHERLGEGKTYLQMMVGPDSWFHKERIVTANAVDAATGVGYVAGVVEGNESVVWTKPEDIAYDERGPLPEFGGVNPFDPSFYLVTLAGDVKQVRKDADLDLLRDAIRCNPRGRIDWEEIVEKE